MYIKKGTSTWLARVTILIDTSENATVLMRLCAQILTVNIIYELQILQQYQQHTQGREKWKPTQRQKER